MGDIVPDLRKEDGVIVATLDGETHRLDPQGDIDGDGRPNVDEMVGAEMLDPDNDQSGPFYDLDGNWQRDTGLVPDQLNVSVDGRMVTVSTDGGATGDVHIDGQLIGTLRAGEYGGDNQVEARVPPGTHTVELGPHSINGMTKQIEVSGGSSSQPSTSTDSTASGFSTQTAAVAVAIVGAYIITQT
jgi:hypothetical protein